MYEVLDRTHTEASRQKISAQSFGQRLDPSVLHVCTRLGVRLAAAVVVPPSTNGSQAIVE
jgi:hypothetical protein